VSAVHIWLPQVNFPALLVFVREKVMTADMLGVMTNSFGATFKSHDSGKISRQMMTHLNK